MKRDIFLWGAAVAIVLLSVGNYSMVYAAGEALNGGVPASNNVANELNTTGVVDTDPDPGTTTYVGTNSTTVGTTNTLNGAGTTTIQGTTTNVTGTSSVNVNTSSGSVAIGNTSGTTTVNGSTTSITGGTTGINATSVVTITGNTDNVASSEGVVINSNAEEHAAPDAHLITGQIKVLDNGVFINTSYTNNGATTSYPTSNVFIGNSSNTTSINSVTNNIGVNAFATANNIGTGSAASTNTIGNTNSATTVTARGGNSTLSVASGTAYLTAGTTLGTNGTSGTTSGNNSGGLTVYETAQTIGHDATIQTTLSPGGILEGKTYQNKVNGNLFVDGNVYINGTLDYVSSNAANTTVMGSSTSTSNLPGASVPVTAGTAIVMKGSTVGTQTVVDVNGKLTNNNVPGTGATESTASMTLTNGLGQTHGIVITETQTTISGGRSSSAMTLHDDGATFSNTSNGEPVRVHGVDDGLAPYDAVNVRQLGAGLAMVAGLAALPQVEPGKRFAIGVGTGGYMSQVSIAGGISARFLERFVVKGGCAFVPGYDGHTVPVWNAGLQYSF